MNQSLEPLIEAIVREVHGVLPQPWSEATVTAMLILGLTEVIGTFRSEPDAAAQTFSVPFSVLDAFGELRERMADNEPGKGAWYTAVLDMTPPAAFRFSFDYEHFPNFTYAPPDEKIEADRRRFPRGGTAATKG